ncbi:MAG: hypothetical protein ACKVJU_07065 [Verrucomicrobiales bacterium]
MKGVSEIELGRIDVGGSADDVHENISGIESERQREGFCGPDRNPFSDFSGDAQRSRDADAEWVAFVFCVGCFSSLDTGGFGFGRATALGLAEIADGDDSPEKGGGFVFVRLHENDGLIGLGQQECGAQFLGIAEQSF